MARLARTTPQYISNLEHGRTLPSVPMLARIAEATGASLDHLVGLAERRARTPVKTQEPVDPDALEKLQKEVMEQLKHFRRGVMRDMKRLLSSS